VTTAEIRGYLALFIGALRSALTLCQIRPQWQTTMDDNGVGPQEIVY
jgi:hypothetical protein